MKKPFTSFADAKRRVEQGASVEFTHLADPAYSGPTHVVMWDSLGFAIALKFVPPRASLPAFYVRWPKQASDFDAATGTIYKKGEPAFIIQLRD